MYRADEEALRARLEVTERALAERARRAAEAERALAETRERLARLRDGVAEEDDLDAGGLGRYVRALQGAGVVGLGGAVVAAVLFAATYFPSPDLTLDGVRNAAWIVRHEEGLVGLSGAAAILVLASPWAVLPIAGAVGVARRRRWGWLVSIVAALLFLPTPAFPMSLLVLRHLFSARIRQVFFAI